LQPAIRGAIADSTLLAQLVASKQVRDPRLHEVPSTRRSPASTHGSPGSAARSRSR